jgi:hypothetical protein
VDGVYQTRLDLRNPEPPAFRFTADSPPDQFTARALQLPEVEEYWQFARFPVIRTSTEGNEHFVDFGENRFVTRRGRGPQPFTYRVGFDSAGNVIEEGWQSNGVLMRRMKRFPPPQSKGVP